MEAKFVGGTILSGALVLGLFVGSLGSVAQAATISKTGGNPSKTGTTEFFYQGFKNHSTLGAISENKYRMKVSGTGGAFMGVRGVYSEHDHYRRGTRCGITSIVVGTTFGYQWSCAYDEWIRFKKDDRSSLYTSSEYGPYKYSRAQLKDFQPQAVGVATRTCLDLVNSPNVCSSHAQASKDV